MSAKLRFPKISEHKQKFARPILRDILAGLLVALISLAGSLWAYREVITNVFKNKIPLAGDGLITRIYLQLIENSSYWSIVTQNLHSRNYGWPGEISFTSFPIGNLQEVLVMKLFSDISNVSDPAQLVHIFSIMKAPLIALSTYLLARIIGINRMYSSYVAIIFSLNTFNLVRGEGHFFLALTWALPIGLASIFLAFKQIYSDDKISKKEIAIVVTLASFSSMSGFYLNFFLLILTITAITYLLVHKLLKHSKDEAFVRVRKSLSEVKLILIVFAIFSLGFIAQTIPTLIRSRSILSLVGIADRGFTESIIYSGTPESLFYDLYSLMLRNFGREDFAAYLQSRISWESSQVGALSGLILMLAFIFLIALSLTNLLGWKNSWKISHCFKNESLTFLYLLTTISLALYFVSPLNFGISRLVPQIRAWGRLSLVISLLTLLFLGFVLTKFKVKSVFLGFMVSVLLIIPIMEISIFHNNRPPSSILNQVANTQDSQLRSSIVDLKSKFSKNCSLVNLPVYPFPEFDRPDDQNIDYGQLQLPTQDDGYFRWSYAGVKATANFSAWQPLVSEFPPFSRASIENQIKYASTLGACGAVIDRSYLVPSEVTDLNSLIAKKQTCISPLRGTQFNQIERYVSIDFVGKNCKQMQNMDLLNFASESKRGNFLWRIEQLSSKAFEGIWQVFSPNTGISVRFIADSNSVGSIYFLKVKGFSSQSLSGSVLTVCLTKSNSNQTRCQDSVLNESAITEVELPSNFSDGKVEKFVVTLKDSLDSTLTGWGIQITGTTR